jgi:ABC-type uncharacterized transport system permease subunit
VTEQVPPTRSPDAEAEPGLAARLELYQRAGGIVTPFITVLLAFLIGGLVVLVVAGANPLTTYREIFNGTGLNWFLPWETCSYPCRAAGNLQQTLIQFTVLVLTGLAVAFAFRCGLFNIGGQGQYIVGLVLAVLVGTSFHSLPFPLHMILAIVAAALGGALWAGIAGFLKATVGAHEVITTIMLNWIAIFVARWLVGFGGPLQAPEAELTGVAVTRPVDDDAELPVIWGQIQALHAGLFIAFAALVVYWIVLNRTTLGFEVKAVGFNPDAAAYGGISVRRNYFLAMAISGAFAGTAGAMDLLGWQHSLEQTIVDSYSYIAFLGIAVALLGRNSAVGVLFAALLFAALKTGTSTRNLDPEVFRPELAGNLTEMIQGLVVLFVGAEILVLSIWAARRKLRVPSRKRGAA